MQRKRSNVYGAGPSVLHHRHSQSTVNKDSKNHDPHLGVFGKHDFFTDLRVEIDRELGSKHANHPGLLRTKTSIIRSLANSKGVLKSKPRPGTINDSSAQPVASSNTQQISRRCQSASALRKKLFNAVEQGSTGSSGYHHPNHKLQAQVDALQNLAPASFSRSLSKTSNGYRTPNADAVSICPGKSSRMASGVPAAAKTQNQDECIEGVGLGPSRSASISILMSNPGQASGNSSIPNLPPSVLVGGYRSSSVQLEVELVERLNEIGRSNLPEKTLSRTRACQNVLDSIVLQDDHYGRLLSRIRDEFGTYVDMTSRKSPTKSNKSKGKQLWCACGQDVFEFALLKQENSVMKKRVNSMHHEIEALQAALKQAKAGKKSECNNDTTCSSNGSWIEDDQVEEDDLDDVQLFPSEEIYEHSRPQGVSMLSFVSLPAYTDEEEDEEEFQ